MPSAKKKNPDYFTMVPLKYSNHLDALLSVRKKTVTEILNHDAVRMTNCQKHLRAETEVGQFVMDSLVQIRVRWRAAFFGVLAR